MWPDVTQSDAGGARVVSGLTLSMSGGDVMQEEGAKCEDDVAISNTDNETGWEIEEEDCNATNVPTTCVIHDDNAGCAPVVGGGITGDFHGVDLTVDWTSRPVRSARLEFDFAREGDAWTLDHAVVEADTPEAQNVYGLHGAQGATERPNIGAPLGVWWRGDVTLQLDEHARPTLRNAHFRAMK
jgi:hypothetical protein